MTYIFLPEGADFPAAAGGETEWCSFPQGRDHLIDFANALTMPVELLRAERIKSTPSPWARLLLFESALFDKKHPAHPQVLGEWRGLLTLIGLSPYLGVNLDFSRVNLEDSEEVLTNLGRLKPEDSGTLFEQLTLIYANGGAVPVGATSPRSLVFTGIRSINDPGVPFFDRATGRLTDPTECYRKIRDADVLHVLDGWLQYTNERLRVATDELKDPLGKFQPTGSAPGATRVNHLSELFKDWKAATDRALRAMDARPSLGAAKFAPIGLGSGIQDESAAKLYGLIAAVTIEGGSADDVGHPFKIVRGRSIIDPSRGTVKAGNRLFSGRLRLPKGQICEVSEGRVDPHGTAVAGAINIDGLWTRQLIEVVGAVPGVAITLGTDRGGKRREYLLPFDAAILDSVPPEQLVEWTKIADSTSGVTVTLTLPVGNELSVEFTRTFGTGDHPILDSYHAPDVVIWPNFESRAWTTYLYSTYQRAKRDTLVATPIQPATHSAASDGKRWGSVTTYPRTWRVHDEINPAIGGLFFVVAPEPAPDSTSHAHEWHLSIDFGSTETRIFRRLGADAENIAEVVIAPRARMVFGTPEHLEYIFLPSADKPADRDAAGKRGHPEHGVPSLVWLPLGSPIKRDAGWMPSDGHVFMGLQLGPAQDGSVVGNLKWRPGGDSESATFENFVKHVFTAVAAEAALDRAKIVSLRTAYPSVLPGWLQAQHERAWSNLAKSFNVNFVAPESEARAVASFLKRRRQAPASANLLAVDVGGSTADFALWRGSKAHFDSIKVAGNIFNQVVAFDAQARAEVDKAAKSVLREDPQWDLSAADPKINSIHAGLLLRKLSRETGTGVLDFGRRLYDGPGSAGARILSHIAYAYAVIGFTLGLLTRHAEIDDDNYHVFFAGRGSILLRWLDAMAANLSETWFKQFFLSARAAADRPESANVNIDHPQTNLKDEVGIGLLLAEANVARNAEAKARPTPTRSASAIAAPSDLRDQLHVTFVGEMGYRKRDETPLGWSEELYPTMMPDIDSARRVPVSEMKFLRAFLAEFETTLSGQLIADSLGLRAAVKDDQNLRDVIHQRIFGVADLEAIGHDRTLATKLLIEPFFVTEAKVLLEQATRNPNIFAN